MMVQSLPPQWWRIVHCIQLSSWLLLSWYYYYYFLVLPPRYLLLDNRILLLLQTHHVFKSLFAFWIWRGINPNVPPEINRYNRDKRCLATRKREAVFCPTMNQWSCLGYICMWLGTIHSKSWRHNDNTTITYSASIAESTTTDLGHSQSGGRRER